MAQAYRTILSGPLSPIAERFSGFRGGSVFALLGRMRNLCKLAILGVVGLFLAVSCSGKDPLTGPDGTGGMSGGTGGDCRYPNYNSPGCGGNAVRTCDEGAGGRVYCTQLACGCDGKITRGCVPNLSVPYAYALPAGVDAGYQVGDTCDPSAAP